MNIQNILKIFSLTFLIGNATHTMQPQEAQRVAQVWLRVDSKTNKSYKIYALQPNMAGPKFLADIGPNQKDLIIKEALPSHLNPGYNSVLIQDPRTGEYPLMLQSYQGYDYVDAQLSISNPDPMKKNIQIASVRTELNRATQNSYLIQLTLKGDTLETSSIEVTGVQR